MEGVSPRCRADVSLSPLRNQPLCTRRDIPVERETSETGKRQIGTRDAEVVAHLLRRRGSELPVTFDGHEGEVNEALHVENVPIHCNRPVADGCVPVALFPAQESSRKETQWTALWQTLYRAIQMSPRAQCAPAFTFWCCSVLIRLKG